MKNKIAILFGGTSSERIISLSSGNAILNSLIRSGYNAHLIDTRDFPIIQLKKQNFNIAYITLHGKGGEDESIQGFLEYLYIPYTGSNVTASSIAIDKLKSKILWKFYSLPIGPYIYLKKNIFHKKLYLFIIKKILKLGLPVFIKPNRQGSSIGITLVNTEKNIINALNTAFFYDDIVLIEKYLDGQEYTISILGKRILPSIRIYTKSYFYDYNAKYRSNNTQYHCPSGLNKNEENKAQKIAKKHGIQLDVQDVEE